MKSLRLLLLATCVLLLNTTHAQTIRRVNNNAGVTGVNVYTTAQAAHDAANANDILMIEPSVTSYGDLTLTKPLKIYGNGYYLDTNTELKADQRSSSMNSIRFNTGSGGSAIYGLDFTGYIDLSISGVGTLRTNIAIFGVSDVTIQRCKTVFGTFIFNQNQSASTNTNVSNIFISKNFLENGSGQGVLVGIPASGFTISNVLISNNLINYAGLRNNANTGILNWIVTNNTFSSSSVAELTNSIFENNILAAGGVPSFTNVTSSYNVSTSNSFSGGFNNQNNFTVSTELIGSGGGISADEAYQIKSGSLLKTAGSGGTEVGAYGGATPYVVSGIPAIPSVVNMNNTATGSNTVPLQVTISVKGNN